MTTKKAKKRHSRSSKLNAKLYAIMSGKTHRVVARTKKLTTARRRAAGLVRRGSKHVSIRRGSETFGIGATARRRSKRRTSRKAGSKRRSSKRVSRNGKRRSRRRVSRNGKRRSKRRVSRNGKRRSRRRVSRNGKRRSKRRTSRRRH